VATLVLLSLLFSVVDWDMAVASHYYHLDWPGREPGLAQWLYRFAQLPAQLAGIGGGLVFLLSYRRKDWVRWRGPGLFLFLLLLLGPGLLVNGLLKDLSGRPRPSEVSTLGGMWPFARVWHWGLPGKGQSFPSGHASMAYYWTCLFFLARGRKRWLGLGLGLAFGALMSWARMSQGGHFLSDTLFSGAFIFTLAAALSPLIHWQPAPEFWSCKPVLIALVAGLAGYGLISQIVYEERELSWVRDVQGLSLTPIQRLQTWNGSAPLDKVALDLSLQRGDMEVAFTAVDGSQALPLQVNEQFWGEGLPGAKDSLKAEPLGQDPLFLQGPGTLGARVQQSLRGLWLSVSGRYVVELPQSQAVDARLRTADGVLTIDRFPPGRQILLSGVLRQEDLPGGFKPFGSSSWLLEGAQPQIALTLSAPEMHFQP
jgi:lipid A 4'-phosphatase